MNEVLKSVPHNIDAEQAVLGGAMLNGAAWDVVADRVKQNDFYSSAHRAIYRAIVALDAEGKPFDVVSVAEWMQANGEDCDLPYISDLANNVASTANIAAHADIVRGKSIERALLTASMQIGQIVYGEGDAKQKLDQAQALVTQIASDSITNGPVMASALIPAVLDEIEKNMNAKGGLIGLSTGYADLDRITCGLQKTDLIIIAGRPSMGKTSLALNIAENAAMEGETVLIFSMEMSATQLLQRSMSSIARVPLQNVRSGKMEDEHWPRITNATQKLIQSRLMIDESPALTVLDIRARARRVHRERPLGLIVLDYLQLMSGEGENRNTEISTISRGLKALAKEMKIPVIALSQLNRSVEQRTNKRPSMSDLRDSGAIEQDADVIAFIYRDEVYNPDSEARGTAEIIFSKQRQGETGMVRLTFAGQFCRFDNYAGPPISNVVRSKRFAGGFDE